MAWYAAHAIMAFRLKEGRQARLTVWENILLIEGSTPEEAYAKAEARAREDEGDNGGTLTLGGQPCVQVYCGIRKLLAVSNPSDDDKPTDRAEISFTMLEVADEDALQRLVRGTNVTLEYQDERPWEERSEVPPELLG